MSQTSDFSQNTHTLSHLKSRNILITSALPYANGSIHLGHLVEYIQTDIWARFLRMQGHNAYYICADDTHGTAIMLKAQKDNITPQALIAQVGQEHQEDFANFDISFDHYGSTDSPANKTLCYEFYDALCKQNLIKTKMIEQAYDEVAGVFLPDRFIKGTCPKCKAPDQYGDGCEVCGAHYAPTELIDGYSVISQSKPILKESEHYFFALSDARCIEFLQNWVQCLDQPEAINKLQEWLKEGKLNDWDISRDAPYFGFEIPGTGKEGKPAKYFYVWLDAPVGYYASFKECLDAKGLDINDWIKPESNAEQYHFIGKDILYFHTLFWPSMLHFAGFKTPNNVFAHGFLTVNGQKMSKSRGTFITAKNYIDSNLSSDCLRYYFASKLSKHIEDIDLNLQDFMQKINSDLVGKFINIASRSSGFLHKKFQGALDDGLFEHEILKQIRAFSGNIAKYYEQREYNKAIKEIMQAVDLVNTFVDEIKPWTIKENDLHLQQVCSLIMQCFKVLAIYLKPVLPKMLLEIEQFLNTGELTWQSIDENFSSGHTIGVYQHLLKRIEEPQLKVLLDTLVPSV